MHKHSNYTSFLESTQECTHGTHNNKSTEKREISNKKKEKKKTKIQTKLIKKIFGVFHMKGK